MLQELEPGWWILASIDLTRLPAAVKSTSNDSNETSTGVEYSSREVSPPLLLLKQLQQAHSIFLLHHGSGLNDLHSRLGRQLFTATLERYWNRFARDWDVLLHGNPAVDIYDAAKIAGGGELGIGVGEEEWGSGEREVLEDFVRRTEGMVDVVVGRYGDQPVDVKEDVSGETNEAVMKQPDPWLGIGNHPRPCDGTIFSGTGALSKTSLTTVSRWMDAIFRHGESAYGVGDNPTSRPRQRRQRRKPHGQSTNGGSGRSRSVQTTEPHPRIKSPGGRGTDLRRKAIENAATPPGIPAPLVGSVERSLDQALANVQKRGESQTGEADDAKSRSDKPRSEDESSYFDAEKLVGYLKLGYGSSWTLNPKGFGAQKDEIPEPSPGPDPSTPPSAEPEPPPLQELDPTPDISDTEQEEPTFVQRLEQSIGKFLIGLSGDLNITEFEVDPGEETQAVTGELGIRQSRSRRVVMRTINVQLSRSHQPVSSQDTSDGATIRASTDYFASSTMPPAETTKLRAVLYIHQPFIFVFLFELQTPSLTMPSFYRSLHHQVGPLQKPLLRSTDPSRIPERIAQHMDMRIDGTVPTALGLYDLVYDPVKNTVRTSIPNIPIPGTLAAEGILSANTSNTTAAAANRTVSGAWYTLGIPIGSIPGSSSSTTNPNLNLSTPDRMTEWTRIDALNVHTSILNTYISTHTTTPLLEIERTVKTGRAWWIVWLRVPRHGAPANLAGMATPSAPVSGKATPMLRREETDENAVAEMGGGEREAFLVRKSVDVGGKRLQRGGKSAGRWLSVGTGVEGGREVSGGSEKGGGTATTARGVVEGVGVDARRWVEGLGRLS